MKQTNDPSIGRVVLGRYRIVYGLARGGMGEIYLARSEGAAGFAKPVVIKRILSEFTTEDTVVQMFKREARIMSNLQHPGIVSVLDFGYEEGSYFMVLEYVHGLHAGRWRKFVTQTQQEFPVERAVTIAIAILEALHYAHTVKGPDGRELQIIHRDVSPSNVLIDVDGHVKLADFGIARMATNDAGEWKTSDLTVKGKFPYLPPEIFAGDQPAPTTDIYAVAVVLHEIIQGQNEFRADSASATVGKVLSHVPKRLTEVRSDVSEAIADAVAKGLAKKPQDRWTTAQEFAQALRKAREFDSDEAANEIGESARRDFNDPRVVTVLGIEELATLERAWRASAPRVPKPEGSDVDIDIPLFASTRPPAPSGAPPAISTAPTRAGITTTSGTGKTKIEDAGATRRPPQANRAQLPAARGQAAPVAEKKSFPWVLVILGILAAGGVGLGVYAALRPPPAPADSGQVFVVVNPNEPNPNGTGPSPGNVANPQNNGTTAPTAVPDAGAATVATPNGTKIRNTNPPNNQGGGTPRAGRIEAPFARRGSEINGCFNRFSSTIEGSPTLRLHFDIDTSGHVTEATIGPEGVGATELGRCILDIARSTDFGAREEAVSFSLPLASRRQQAP